MVVDTVVGVTTHPPAVNPLAAPVVPALSGDPVFLLAHQPAGFTDVIGVERQFPGWEALARESGRVGGFVDVAELDRRIVTHRQALLSEPGGYSEQRAAVIGWHQSGDALQLEYFASDYAATEVLRAVWLDLPEQARREPLSDGLQPAPLFGSSVGVDVTVRTADDRLIVARRAPQLSFGGLWHVSAAESVNLAGSVNGCLDFIPDAHRAVREELGLDTVGLPILAHSLLFDAALHGFTLACHIDLMPAGVTAADVRQAHRSAPDSWEATELADVPFTVDSLLAPLDEPHRWVPGALVILAALAAARFGVGVHDALPDGIFR